MGSGSFLKVVLKNFDVLAGPLVTLVYPLYASVKAIETKSHDDDRQWLTYWVLYSLITLFELTFAKAIEWIPFWPYAKLIANCWLVLPYFSGATYVYEHFVRPLFVNTQTVNIWYVPRKKDIFSQPDDVLFAAEKFIEENGPEAFQKLINKSGRASKSTSLQSEKASKSTSLQSEKASKSRKSGSRSIIDEVYAEKGSMFSSNCTIIDEVQAERESNSRDSYYTIFDNDDRY